ncbi:MAG: glucose-6-phosphate isomerase, partial [Lysobacteraceae bacterium]
MVNIGIGGSDLGPRLAVDALRDFHDGRLRVHFLANVDGSAAQHLLRSLDPARTAAILVSKSFGTQETLLNGAIVRDWLGGSERLYAVSANLDATAAYGISGDRVLPMWDWVG